MPNVTGLSKAQAAALAGVGVRRLEQLTHEDDPPPRSSDGTYPPKEFGDWLRRRQLASLGVAQDGTVYDYDAERARFTHHQANIAALDEAKRRGELIPAKDVAREWADMVGRCRSKLLALPVRISTHAMTCVTVRECEDFARGEVHAALDELANEIAEHADDAEDDPPSDNDAMAATAAPDARIGAT